MAKSDNTTVNVTSDVYIKLRYSWSAGTPNIANNFTPVNWTLQLISSNSSANINSRAAKDYSVTTDGTPKSGTNTIGLSGGSAKTLASGSKIIYHNADGSQVLNVINKEIYKGEVSNGTIIFKEKIENDGANKEIREIHDMILYSDDTLVCNSGSYNEITYIKR